MGLMAPGYGSDVLSPSAAAFGGQKRSTPRPAQCLIDCEVWPLDTLAGAQDGLSAAEETTWNCAGCFPAAYWRGQFLLKRPEFAKQHASSVVRMRLR